MPVERAAEATRMRRWSKPPCGCPILVILFGLATALLACPLPARAAEGHFFLLGGDLYKGCVAGKKGWGDDLRVGTYAEAAADGQELYVASGGSPKFCLTDAAGRADLSAAVCDYLKSNTDKRTLSGMAVTLEALAARYPCGR